MFNADKDLIFKLFDSLAFTTKFVIPIDVFKKMHQYDVPVKKLKEYTEDFIAFRNKWIGYNLGNSPVIYQSNKGNNYSISIYPDIKYSDGKGKETGTASFHMWSEKGDESLLSLKKIPWETALDKELLEIIYNTIKEYEEGFIHCSDCGKLIKKEEVAGRYFAGRYCKDCWEREWKAIEAKETYD